MTSQTLTQYIAVPPASVYSFARNPENLPLWVPSFCQSVAFTNGAWVVQSSLGPATFAFAEENPWGVLDHSVVLASGQRFHNPMRVVANGEASELMFTLFQHEGMSDTQFAEDAVHVRRDLLALKTLLEAAK